MNFTQEQIEGADCIVNDCGCLRGEEQAVVICDPDTRESAELVHQRARRISRQVDLIEIPTLGMHGKEPPAEAARMMAESDLVFGMTYQSMAHTRARIAAAENGTRYLSLPEYSLGLLADEALRADFQKGGRMARVIADIFTAGERVHVTTAAGTDIHLDIAGRVGNCCPGYVDAPGALGSPPDIEANVSPVEDRSEGVVVVDGSIPVPSLGLLPEPVQLTVANGGITRIDGPSDTVDELERLFNSTDPVKSRILAECGLGLNEKAALTGNMLTDEGAIGTMHFGFGSNFTVGGKNEVSFHLDFVFRNPTLSVDSRVVVADGKACPP